MSHETPKELGAPRRTFTIREFLSHIFPTYSDGERPTWPPDAFAITAALLKRSGAYTEIVRLWPPIPHSSVDAWHTHVKEVAAKWRQCYSLDKEWPREIAELWETILQQADLDIAQILNNHDVIVALASIVAIADEMCEGFGNEHRAQHHLESYAVRNLTIRKTLCDAIDPSFLMVLPKSHNPVTGMTLRSLTHNLALWDNPEVVPEWYQVNIEHDTGNLNVLLLPWPLTIPPRAFQTCEPEHYRMPTEFGFFSYQMPNGGVEVPRVEALFRQAENLVGKINVIVFPELSLSRKDFDGVRNALPDSLIVAGIGTSGGPNGHGTNKVAIGDPDTLSVTRQQDKHHRWRLDWSQINQYGVGSAFSGHKYWWEAISIDKRAFTVLVSNNLTLSVLLCEDLARQDPVAALVRAIGPTLVIALLMDGPQVPERWSARYATVLSEDPRSSVLTLTCAGMVDLANSQRRASDSSGPRSIALWRDAFSGQARPIILDAGAEAVAISLTSRKRTEFTADGRPADEHYLELRGIHQVIPPAATAQPASERTISFETAEIKGKE